MSESTGIGQVQVIIIEWCSALLGSQAFLFMDFTGSK